jgi:hypothetical protein
MHASVVRPSLAGVIVCSLWWHVRSKRGGSTETPQSSRDPSSSMLSTPSPTAALRVMFDSLDAPDSTKREVVPLQQLLSVQQQLQAMITLNGELEASLQAQRLEMAVAKAALEEQRGAVSRLQQVSTTHRVIACFSVLV